MGRNMNTMVAPEYVGNPKSEKIRLQGRVLIFGSGQLTHERLFFDFSSVTSVTTYDPFVEPVKCAEISTTDHHNDLKEPLRGDLFDAILCLFSLHYEPCWLFTLAQLFQKLTVGGLFALAEDRGVRAIFDNGSVENGTVDVEVHEQYGELYNFVREVFAKRELRDWGAPWFPDVSASDYSLAMQVLSVVADKTDERLHSLRRKTTSDEPLCYLPWQPCFANGRDLETQFQNMPRPEEAPEKIKITCFTKVREFTDLLDLNHYLTRAVWNVISLRAERNVSRILISLSRSAGNDVEAMSEHFSRSFLRIAYLNVFRHFQTVKTCEVTLGLLSGGLLSSPRQAAGKMVTTLIPANFTPARELNLRFEKEAWYTDYIDDVQKRGVTFLGEFLSERRQPGLYFWHRNSPLIENKDMLRARIPELHFVEDEPDLLKAYQERNPPSCVYLLEPLGRYDGASTTARGEYELLGAGIAYLSDDYSPEIGCLLYVLRSVMPAVVGRSAFIEMLLHQKSAETFQRIRDKLDRIQANLKVLQQVTGDVESLKTVLDPTYWAPGQEKLNRLQEMVYENVLSTKHNLWEIKKSDLLTGINSNVEQLQAEFIKDLRDHGFPSTITDKLFEKWNKQGLRENLLAAVYFSRAVGKGLFPPCWLLLLPNFEGEAPDQYFIDCYKVPQTTLLSAMWRLGRNLKTKATLKAENSTLKLVAPIIKEGNRDLEKLNAFLGQIKTGATAMEIEGSGETTQILEILWHLCGCEQGALNLTADGDALVLMASLHLTEHPSATPLPI